MKNRFHAICHSQYCIRLCCIIFCLCSVFGLPARTLRFAQISDTHIRPNHSTISDLSRSVRQINAMDSVDFVILTGDITHKGDKESLMLAKALLDSLIIPYYIIPGNHDTKFGTQCINDFIDVFGAENFLLGRSDIVFVGLNTGQLGVSEGSVSAENMLWLDSVLQTIPDEKVKFLVTHHPIQEGDITNWQELGDMIVKYKIDYILSGHYHINMLFDCFGIPDVITRTNQSNEVRCSGFSLITISGDTIKWEECSSDGVKNIWLELPFVKK